MYLLSRDVHQIKVFVLQVQLRPMYLPCQGDIDICQVLAVSLEIEVPVIQQVFELLHTIVDTDQFNCAP